MTNPYDDDLSLFAVTFLRAVIAWNNAENTARRILISYGGGGFGLTVAVEHLGSIALRDALYTLCDSMSAVELEPTTVLREHIEHFVGGMDVLRGYRNFYVHSLRYIGKTPDDPTTFAGFLHSVEAKGRYALIGQHITTTDLQGFMRQALTLEQYGRDIAANIPGNTNALAAVRAANVTPLASLQKPTWPEKLKKSRTYLTGLQPQPEPSQE